MSVKGFNVTKASGVQEPYNDDQFYEAIYRAVEGYEDVSASEILLKTNPQIYDGIKTSELHAAATKEAANMISMERPGHQYAAGHLVLEALRKQVLGQYDPIPVLEVVKKNIGYELYDPIILEKYSEDEFKQFDIIINHDRDKHFTYAALEQFKDKYLVQDRTNGAIYETPQYLYLLVAATVFMHYDTKVNNITGKPYGTKYRMKLIKNLYDAMSNFELSIPSPILAGVRTPLRQYSSCVLVETSDSLKSINATANVIVEYAAQRAGLGIGAGALRALGDPVRKGQAFHTGVLPFFQKWQGDLKSCNQGGIRPASATLNMPIWHKEAESIMQFKNNKGKDTSRARNLDYCIQINGYLWQRYLDGKDISLFSPYFVQDLYDAFFEDQAKFAELYEKYEADESVPRKTVPAKKLIEELLAAERFETGRIYVMNTDHVNEHSGFNEKKVRLRMTNLCVEICLPTKPLNNIDDPEGSISLCILAAYNLGKIKKARDFERLGDIAVRMLDALIDHQTYPVKAAEITTMRYRSLGVGVINYAYFLAKNGFKYEEAAFGLTHETFEAMQFFLLKASMNLAKEQGRAPGFEDTKFADGILPIDTYKKAIDEYAPFPLLQDWEGLRKDIVTYGLRNCTLSALMPSEASSQVANATNGFEPPRELVTVKKSRSGLVKQVVPDVHKIKDKIQLAWDMKSNHGYIKHAGIVGKFICQSGSWNTYYNPEHYEQADGKHKVPMSVIVGDMLLAYKVGLKTMYYANIYDGAGKEEEEIPQVDHRDLRYKELSAKNPIELSDAEMSELIDLMGEFDSDGCASGACAI